MRSKSGWTIARLLWFMETKEQEYDRLDAELDRLRTPVDSFGRTYLGIACHDVDRVREIRQRLSILDREFDHEGT